jgi:hypothetical protein
MFIQIHKFCASNVQKHSFLELYASDFGSALNSRKGNAVIFSEKWPYR